MRLHALTVALLLATTIDAMGATVVPTRYEAGHFFATPTLAGGQVLKLVVDTGGGGVTWTLTETIVKRLGLRAATCDKWDGLVEPPVFAPGKGLPTSPRACAKAMSAPDDVLTMNDGQHGMLGGWYLSSHTWTFDYPGHQLVMEDATWKAGPHAHATQLGFPLNVHGKLGSPLPRISLIAGGEPIDLLLDTGATAHPSPNGLKAMKTPTAPDGYAAGSYIITSVMNRWHKAHPDWPLVEDADDFFGPGKSVRAIRVPDVEVGGWKIGPVWFTERADANFTGDGLSQWMDGDVYGALGGNALAAFRMTIDYPSHRLWLICVENCRSADNAVRH